MDQALKARLIGATVLVVLAVLLIPELLSGRRSAEPPTAAQGDTPRGTRTFTIDLGGSGSGAPTAAPERVEPRPAQPAAAPPEGVADTAAAPSEPTVSRLEPMTATPSPPVPAATQPLSDAKASDPVAARAAESPAPASVAPPSEAAPSAATRGGWSVQVGAFGTAAAAGKLVRELQDAGYRAYVSPVARGGKTLHRVRVGPEPDRGSATSLVAGLQARGLPASVVAND